MNDAFLGNEGEQNHDYDRVEDATNTIEDGDNIYGNKESE